MTQVITGPQVCRPEREQLEGKGALLGRSLVLGPWLLTPSSVLSDGRPIGGLDEWGIGL